MNKYNSPKSAEHLTRKMKMYAELSCNEIEIRIKSRMITILGGTDFQPALMLARHYIDKEQEFDKADIIFISDGEAGISQDFLDSFNQWKAERKVFVHTVLIDAGCSTPTIIDKFSDKYDVFTDMLGENNIRAAVSIFDHFID